MLRTRIFAVLAGLAVLAAAGFGAAQLAAGAVDNPALAGQRIWCIDGSGVPHFLVSPCSKYKMWYFGNGANLTVRSADSAPTVTATVTATPTTPPSTTPSVTTPPPAGGGQFAVNGEFCATAGAKGVTSKGAPMVCMLDMAGRLRWRPASSGAHTFGVDVTSDGRSVIAGKPTRPTATTLRIVLDVTNVSAKAQDEFGPAMTLTYGPTGRSAELRDACKLEKVAPGKTTDVPCTFSVPAGATSLVATVIPAAGNVPLIFTGNVAA